MITMQITAPFSREEEQFLSDIITAAVEGGIGYWSQVQDYDWFNYFDRPAEEFYPTTVTVFDTEEHGEDAEPMHLTIEKVAEGINKLITGWPGAYTTNYTLKGLSTLDAGEIDSDAADVIVQCALLGEIVYG